MLLDGTVLAAAARCVPGDADGDGEVTAADYLSLKENYGKVAMDWGHGDFDKDGIVGIADYLLLDQNFGKIRAYVDDPDLEQGICRQLGLPADHVLTTSDLAQLSTLSLDSNVIQSLSGLQSATNLKTLTLLPTDWSIHSDLTDLTPLSGLRSLETLTIVNAGLTAASLGALATDSPLIALDLRYNQITSLGGIAGLNRLQSLSLYGNPVTDLSGLRGKPVNLDLADRTVDNAQSVSALAAALDYLPLRQYAWVLNNCTFQPYTGAMKGPDAAFETKAGNDWDLSTLLAKLFAADGIPTRFVSSQVQAPAAILQSWLGTLNTSAAGNTLWNADLNPQWFYADGTFITFNHTWLQAQFTDGTGVPRWYDFDPSWKFKQYQPGITGLLAAVPFDQDGYLSHVTTDFPVDYYSRQISDYLHANRPDKSLADVPHDGPIIPQSITALPTSLPYSVVGPRTTNDTVPTSMTYRVRLTFLDRHPASGNGQLFQYTISLPDQGRSRVTIGYTPQGNRQMPHLYIDGQTVADGAFALISSESVRLTVEVLHPEGAAGAYSSTYDLTQGQYLSLAIGSFQISDALLLRDQQAVTNAAIAALNGQVPSPEDQIGAFLGLFGHTYFSRHDDARAAIDGLTMAAPLYERIKTAVVRCDPYVDFYPDLQYPYVPRSVTIDEKGGSWFSVPLDYDWSLEPARDAIAGLNGSALEHGLIEELSNTPAISTVKSFQIAAELGIPALTIDSATAGTLIPQLHLSSDLISSLQWYLDAGDTVTVPTHPTPLNLWTGVGWFVHFPNGTSAYMIQGYLSNSDASEATAGEPIQGGAGTGAPVTDWVDEQIETFFGNPDGNQSDVVAGDPVNTANGNLMADETDMAFPGIGPRLAFARHYDSQVTLDVGMGPGWVYTYSDHLAIADNGAITWFDDQGHRYAFSPNGSGGYASPQTLFGTFTADAQGYVYRDTDGTTYSFDSAGRLTEMRDRNGNGVAVTHDAGGQLQQVVDLADPSRWLLFAFSAGHLTSLLDFTGRTWTYSYGAGGLITVTSPSNAETPLGVVSYDYYADAALGGLLHHITLADGGVRTYAYFANRRVMNVVEELGFIQSFSYNLYRHQTDVCDALGYVTVNEYNVDGTLTKAIQPDGGCEYFTWQGGLKTSWTDTIGNTETYQYDSLGNMTRLVDRAGNVTTATYEPVFGNLTGNISPGGRATSYTYDVHGNLTSVCDALGNLTTMTYDSRGLVLNRTEPNGNLTLVPGDFTTTYTYSSAGQVLTRSTDLPSRETFAYDVRGSLVTRTDADDRATSYVYDLLNRPIGIANAEGDMEYRVYDSMGNLVSSTDRLGRTTRFAYDRAQRLIASTRTDGSVQLTVYDPVGNAVTTLDELGRRTQYAFDSHGRATATLLPDKTMRWVDYDGRGRVVTTTDGTGNKTTYTYDALDRLLVTTDALAGRTTRTHDAAGNQLTLTDPLNRTTAYGYDLGNRLTTTSDPLDHSIAYAYDANGNLLTITDPLNHTVTYGYDVLNRRTTIADASDAVTTTVYDPAGNVLQVIDPNSNTTTYVYDALGRLESDTDPLGRTRLYHYDAVGNLIAITDRDGRTRLFGYDSRGRRTTETWLGDEGGPIAVFTTTYNSAGELVATADANSTYTYALDAMGRVVSITNAGGPDGPSVVLSYTYSSDGDVLSMSDMIDGVAGGIQTWVYDALHRVTGQADSASGVTLRANSTYDPAGQLTSLRRYSAVASVASSTYAYDNAGRLTSLAHARGSTTLASYTWAYDAANRVIQITSADGTSDCAYDATNQLTAADHSYQGDEAYAYDATGNRTNPGYSTGTDNRLLSDGAYTYLYDNEGNRTRRTRIADGQVTDYEWDYRNRLTRVTASDSTGVVLSEAIYTYDALDRRIAKTVDPDGPGLAPAVAERYVWNGQNILLSFDGNGTVAHRYFNSPGVDRVLADRGTGGTVIWALGDKLGTVRDLIDSGGAVLDHIMYDSFGQVTSETNGAAGIRYGFTGHERDIETGLYYCRARYYDPGVGRFVSDDPIGFAGGDANLYRYVRNAPLSFADASGLCSETSPQFSWDWQVVPDMGGEWFGFGTSGSDAYAFDQSVAQLISGVIAAKKLAHLLLAADVTANASKLKYPLKSSIVREATRDLGKAAKQIGIVLQVLQTSNDIKTMVDAPPELRGAAVNTTIRDLVKFGGGVVGGAVVGSAASAGWVSSVLVTAGVSIPAGALIPVLTVAGGLAGAEGAGWVYDVVTNGINSAISGFTRAAEDWARGVQEQTQVYQQIFGP